MESQKKYKPQFSFECYSPKTPESVTYLQNVQLELAQLNPDFFSLTYGAGGSTRNMTFEAVLDISDKTYIKFGIIFMFFYDFITKMFKNFIICNAYSTT